MPPKKGTASAAAGGGDDKSKEKKGGTSVKVKKMQFYSSVSKLFEFFILLN